MFGMLCIRCITEFVASNFVCWWLFSSFLCGAASGHCLIWPDNKNNNRNWSFLYVFVFFITFGRGTTRLRKEQEPNDTLKLHVFGAWSLFDHSVYFYHTIHGISIEVISRKHQKSRKIFISRYQKCFPTLGNKNDSKNPRSKGNWNKNLQKLPFLVARSDQTVRYHSNKPMLDSPCFKTTTVFNIHTTVSHSYGKDDDRKARVTQRRLNRSQNKKTHRLGSALPSHHNIYLESYFARYDPYY